MTELEANKEKNLRKTYKIIIEEILTKRFKSYKYEHYLYSDYFTINLQNNYQFIVRLSNHRPYKAKNNICWISYNFKTEKIKTKKYIESKILSHYGYIKKLSKLTSN